MLSSHPGAFSEYFDCPVLEVPGRSFTVDLHYHPVSKTQRVEAAVNVALNLHVREGPGHILVFLTGMEECEQAVNLANTKLQNMVESGKEVSDCLIVPLYGMMQSDDQRNVFEEVPEGCRKLVFSTNIAETSLTVAGVGFVVDCGYCKQKFFNPTTGMESLQVTEVSQVQAKQRAGRAGRTQHGKCFRLYSEETFHRSLLKITVPEILRSNLASVSLQMKAMGIEEPKGAAMKGSMFTVTSWFHGAGQEDMMSLLMSSCQDCEDKSSQIHELKINIHAVFV